MMSAVNEFKEAASLLSSSGNSSGPGSSAALSLTAGAGVAAALLVVAGVNELRREYQEHKKKEELAKIEEVLKFHRKFLCDIKKTGLDKNPSLPAPFILNESKEHTAATSLKLNDEILADLQIDRSLKTDPFLLQYGLHIIAAKGAILQFYKERLRGGIFSSAKPGDVTSSVLTYLLVMLGQYCTRFEGFQADIAYLGAVMHFINAFASVPKKGVFGTQKDPTTRIRFERLQRAHKELEQARKILIDHSGSRSLVYYVNDLMSSCNSNLVPDLLRIFTKFIVPEEHWEYIDGASYSDLQRGELKPRYRNAAFLEHGAILIPNSIFRGWVQRVVKDELTFEDRGEDSFDMADSDFGPIKKLFKGCPNFLTQKSPQPRADGKREIDTFVPVGFDQDCYFQVFEQLPPKSELVPGSFILIRAVPWRLYEVKENGELTELAIAAVEDLSAVLESIPQKRKLQDIANSSKINSLLTSYRNKAQLKSRANIFLNLGLLLEQLTDLERFCGNLTLCIRALGEIYITNPIHCNFIFESLESLGKDISSRVQSLLVAIDTVTMEQANAKDMFVHDQYMLKTQLSDKLPAIRQKIQDTVSGIIKTHHSNRHGASKKAGEIDPAVYERDPKNKEVLSMLFLSQRLTQKYGIKDSRSELSTVASHSGSPSELSRDGGADFDELKRAPSLLTVRYMNTERGALGDDDPQPLALPLVPDSDSRSRLSDESNTENLVYALYTQKEKIKVQEHCNKRTRAAYDDLYNALRELNIKYRLMQLEDDPDRRLKAKQTKTLADKLCRASLVFLKLSFSQRQAQAARFSQEIQTQLSDQDPANKFLDEHRSWVWKILRALKELMFCLLLPPVGFYLTLYKRGGMFKTSTRAAAYQVEKTAYELSKTLKM